MVFEGGSLYAGVDNPSLQNGHAGHGNRAGHAGCARERTPACFRRPCTGCEWFASCGSGALVRRNARAGGCCSWYLPGSATGARARLSRGCLAHCLPPPCQPANATTLPGCLKFPLKQHGTRSHDAGNHSRLAAQQNAVTDLPKYFPFVNVLKTKQLPVCRRKTPSLTTQPHVMFEPAFANLSSP